VSTLRHSSSLRELDISFSEVTGAGIAGLEEISTLERLDAWGCYKLSSGRCGGAVLYGIFT
jgi:hypothetical protein